MESQTAEASAVDSSPLSQATQPSSAANRSSNNIPSLVQIGRQTSLNCRLSQLYDSGAENSDADEQARLIPLRSHKFIIIPAAAAASASNTAPATMPFRETISTSSLAAISAAQQQPHTPSTPSTPQIQLRRPLSALSYCRPQYLEHSPFPSPTSMSDVAYKHQPTTQSAQTVKFTLDDSDVENTNDGMQQLPAADAATSRSAHTKIIPINSAINSSKNLAPLSITTSIPLSPSLSVRSNAASPPLLSPHFGISAQGNGPRNSSMRSISSVYVPGTNETISFANYPQFLQSSMATSPLGDQQLSSSSYFNRDHISCTTQIFSDVTSVRSLASIGIGSTDGKKLVIRRVPQSPDELFNIPSTQAKLPGLDDDDDDSFMDVSDEAANLKPRKQHWGSKMQFVLACIGYSVGLGNVWRFPYMCYKSGGGVFLVPYCIILIICSLPLLFMELSVGQYTGRGPIGALGQLCPLFKGAGLASVVVSFLMSTYYSVIIGYSIYYFFTAFKPLMPWMDCNNRWNTADCWIPQRTGVNNTSPKTSRTPSEEFFENKVLQISKGIEFPGEMRWELFACLICAWLMVYFATWKSIKSSAKVRYFTATFPFVLIIILMGRAVTLDGANDGLRYFFRPNWSELKNANVWINAASQNFNSLGITFGSMISFASYNKYNNNILRDTVAVSTVNVLTSLLVGVFAFATLGNLALEQNTNVADVIGDGPGLIFVVYPQAMSKMPYAQLWAVMFFFMLLCLGLNSQFAIVEVVVTSIQDGFPNWIKRHLGYNEILVLFICIISFLFGLPNIIQGGIYFFQLMDHYAASVSIMFLAFCQMIAIAWFYGTGRLSKNIKQMTGKAPSLYLQSSWLFLGPCLLFAIWILSLVNYQEPTYHNGRYKYPEWAYGIGWMFTGLSLVCIPGYALVNIIRASGKSFGERMRNTLRPNIYECRICGEHHCEHDYPEQEQFMLAQEAATYKPAIQMKTPTGSPIMKRANEYSPMRLQPNDHNSTYESQQEASRPTHTTAIINNVSSPPTTTR